MTGTLMQTRVYDSWLNASYNVKCFRQKVVEKFKIHIR
jgi:hypothetical protein